MKNVILMVFLLTLAACSYSIYSSGLPHLKTISINSFQNKTTEYDLEEDIYITLSDKFSSDARLSIVTISPDCILEGEILDYSNEVLKYAGSSVDEYEVKILFNIIFTDLVKNKVIWQNPSLLLSETYSASDSNITYKTEEAAQTKIIQDLFDTILKNSLEEW
ncbi:MAG TPA: LPS assembly lipoprotein LptE [Candidatus Cloacimonadota bacterium]|nr:LPS assembly lipoprotein LptE [Candidatus Cloacimonadota bacterium]